MLGSGRIWVMCYNDGKERIGTIRGSMYKRVWIARDDVVLVGLRDFQDDKCDVIFKYAPEEVCMLCRMGHLPDNHVNLAKKETIETEVNEITFEQTGSDEGDDINIDDI